MLKTVFKNRKDLVKAVSEFTGTSAKYMGAPTFAYKVGEYTIDKDGNITADCEMESLKSFLAEKGLIQQETTQKTSQNQEMLIENEENQQDSVKFNIPLDGADKQSVINFVKTLYSKQYLINRALQMKVLNIQEGFLQELENKELSDITNDEYSGFKIENDCFIFDYPSLGGKMFNAYMTLMCMAFSKAKKSTRVQAKLTKPENEKYYMRSWLIRLGLGGKGGAETRRALLKNLNGNSAFRTNEDREKVKAKYKQKKAEKQL